MVALLLVGALAGCAYLGTDAPTASDSPAVPAMPTPTTSPAPDASSPAVDATASPSGFVYTGVIPLCDDVPYLEAPAGWYRDSPIYVGNEMPVEQVRDFARTLPGYQEIWIDRQHYGWVTVAFNTDAAARQAELEERFPDVGVVAVQVDWTMAELKALQRRIADELMANGLAHSAGIPVNKGVVAIGIGPLTAERVAAVEAAFADEPVCLEGFDPTLQPSPGPQPQAGDGWRLLADEDERGQSYRTGIAYDERSYEALWREAGLTGERPRVDFQSEVVIWFGAVHGSSCPNLRLDDVVVDRQAGLVYAQIVTLDAWGACTADAISHAYLVAVQRSKLPEGSFMIQLDAEGPPAGAPEERTLVHVDLSRPGSVAGPGDVTADPSLPEPQYIGPGDIIETGYPSLYRHDVACGLEWLGPVNDVHWRTDDADGTDAFLPPEWQDAVRDDGTIVLEILIEQAQPPILTATASGHTIVYQASPVSAPACD